MPVWRRGKYSPSVTEGESIGLWWMTSRKCITGWRNRGQSCPDTHQMKTDLRAINMSQQNVWNSVRHTRSFNKMLISRQLLTSLVDIYNFITITSYFILHSNHNHLLTLRISDRRIEISWRKTWWWFRIPLILLENNNSFIIGRPSRMEVITKNKYGDGCQD